MLKLSKVVNLNSKQLYWNEILNCIKLKLTFFFLQGIATGNRLALYVRSFFQSLLFTLGSFVQNWAWTVVIAGLSIYLICALGLQYVHIETDLIKLWVSGNLQQIFLIFIFFLGKFFNLSTLKSLICYWNSLFHYNLELFKLSDRLLN